MILPLGGQGQIGLIGRGLWLPGGDTSEISAYAQWIIDHTDAKAYYRLKESSGTVAEDSKNAYDGTIYGSPLKQQQQLNFGEPTAKSFYFDGVDDWIETPIDSTITPAAGGVSLEMVLRTPSSWDTGDFSTTVLSTFANGSGLSTAYHGFQLQLTSAGILKWILADADSKEVTKQLLLDQTYHIVATFSGTQIKLYINGFLIGTVSQGSPTMNASAKWSIGRFNVISDGAYFFSKAYISDVAIYSDDLSQSEIQDHYKLYLGEYGREVLTDSPWVWYRLAENVARAEDSSMNDRKGGSWTGTPSSLQAGALTGDDPYCVILDGTQAFTSPALPSSITTYSIEAWIKTTYSGGSIHQIIDNDAGGSSFQFRISAAGKLQFITLTSGFAQIKTVEDPGSAINDGNWHHVVGTCAWNGSIRTSKLFKDGVLVASDATATAASNISTLAFTVGGFTALGVRFRGSLDEVAFYNGLALSDARVAAHYGAAS